MVVVLLVVH